MDFSRFELKTGEAAEKQQIEVISFVEDFIKEMGTYADSKKHSITFNKKVAGHPTIEINKKALYNVLQNILSNAIEYSPENTAVTINLEKTDSTSTSAVSSVPNGSSQTCSFIKISLSNKGPIIPKDEKTHIFERFYRGESIRKIRPEGTGLGLYIVKKVIEEIGGKVGFDSEEGQDTTFWFTVPIAKQ